MPVVDGTDPYDLFPKKAKLIELIRRNLSTGRRQGQSNPVTTTFLVYAGTTESAGLAWMSAKMKAGIVMYGENAAGALGDETEEDDSTPLRGTSPCLMLRACER